MGCSGPREKLEDKMMLMKLERMEIQMEKEKELSKLSQIEGHKIKPCHVPDYIDPKFAKEKNIYDDDDLDENNDKKTEINGKKKNKKGKEKSKKKEKNDKKGNKGKSKNKKKK
jgi:hypothetical protein